MSPTGRTLYTRSTPDGAAQTWHWEVWAGDDCLLRVVRQQVPRASGFCDGEQQFAAWCDSDWFLVAYDSAAALHREHSSAIQQIVPHADRWLIIGARSVALTTATGEIVGSVLLHANLVDYDTTDDYLSLDDTAGEHLSVSLTPAGMTVERFAPVHASLLALPSAPDELRHCRVCGLDYGDYPWGQDGRTSSFEICPCCGVTFGYEDCLLIGVRAHRRHWLANGTNWWRPDERPADWTLEAQLAQVPAPFRDEATHPDINGATR